MGNRIYGCDDCLAVCPWNKFAKEAADNKYHARNDLLEPELAELVSLDDFSFRKKFSGSPIKRIGRDRFIRNVLYAIGNSHDKKFLDKIEHLVKDPNPVVADAARWAQRELNG
jgi:epoxyqueuosine reductase